jgi:DNA-binding NtrC family response regulator
MMNPHHVLLVGVEPEWRERLVDRLRAAGDNPVIAPSGEAAAEAIASAGFDAVVVDLRAPDLDLARLREALAPARPADPDSLEQAERRHIALVLSHTGGNKRRAAQLLGISRSTLLHKVRKYRLEDR